MQLVLDTETNGFVANLDRIHSIVLRDANDGRLVASCANDPRYAPLREGLDLMDKAEMVIGHNLIPFDLAALKKVYDWAPPKSVVLRDTLVISRLAWPADKLRDADFTLQKKGTLPGNMIGRHSVEAWGYRFQMPKVGTDITDWSTWTPYMHERCEQDTNVNVRLWQHLREQGVPEDVIEVEQRVAEILARQERRGFAFDTESAEILVAKLMRRKAELEAALAEAFPPWEVRSAFLPKANNKKLGYVKGVPTEKVRTAVFNPGSRDHIADRLMKLHGWKPTEFTSTGKPQVDESTISTLQFPQAKLLLEFLMVGKRLGQLVDGKEALIKHVGKDGRIHGSVNPNGANTFRMSHSRPNMSQVPAVRSAYGKEFRACLMASTGMVLVGADADALELRCLAGYMAAYDGGAYIKTVLEGKKEDGTDIHSVNARALGLDPVKKYKAGGQNPTGRDIAKVWFYAFIYGAGDHKLGTILGVTGSDGKIRNAGKATRTRFLKSLPALGKLVERLKEALKKRGYLIAIDGRRLYCRSEHSILNALLQSAGAIFMKHAVVILDDALLAADIGWADVSEFVGNFHDEWQMETKEQHAEFIGQQACAAIALAGERLRFRCPLAGAWNTGKTWADTH